MEVLPARSKVRAGEAHVGEARAVRAAAHGHDLRRYAHALHRRLCGLDEVEVRQDLFLHVIVGIFQHKLHGAAAVFFTEVGGSRLHQGFFRGEFQRVMVADDIAGSCFHNVTGKLREVEEAFIAFSVLRALGGREHCVKLLRHVQGVAHPVLGRTGVDADAVERKLCGSGVEVFIFQLAGRSAIHRIGEIRAKTGDVETICAAADLFIRCKGDADAPMPQLRVRKQIFRECHDLRDAGFVVRTEERGAVRYDNIFPDAVRKGREHAFFNGNVGVERNVAAGVVPHDPRAHIRAGCIGRSIHMRDEAKGGEPFRRSGNAAVNIAVLFHARVRNAHGPHFLRKPVRKRELLFRAGDLFAPFLGLRIKGNIPQKTLCNAFHKSSSCVFGITVLYHIAGETASLRGHALRKKQEKR